MKSLVCSRCKKNYDYRRIMNICECCTSPLLVEYDLEHLRRTWDRDILAKRSRNMWRYRELLPVSSSEEVITLGEGGTPIRRLNRFGACKGFDRLSMMNEGLNPTGTFKSRGASAGITRAHSLGIRRIAMPTAGNAGGAWAAYAASAGIRLFVAMPEDAPEINRRECQMYGADVRLVKGLISDCGQLVEEKVAEEGYFNGATLKEPYRIEGKKTLGLEIAEHGEWTWPDVIVYPTGGGVGLIGIWKAVKELTALGWTTGRFPKMVAVQMEGCAPIVEAFQRKATQSVFWERAQTMAGGLRVPKALGDFLVLESLYESEGTAVAVSDEAAGQMMKELARIEGQLICPEGAAGLAAIVDLRNSGWLSQEESILLLNTGSGMKYLEWMM